MASLADYFQPTANGPANQMNFATESDSARSLAGLDQSRVLRDYSNETLPGIVNANAARGTFFGGQIGVQTDLAKEHAGDQYGDIQNSLNMKLANLRRQGILSATGISI